MNAQARHTQDVIWGVMGVRDAGRVSSNSMVTIIFGPAIKGALWSASHAAVE